jgi:hypothetical protein
MTVRKRRTEFTINHQECGVPTRWSDALYAASRIQLCEQTRPHAFLRQHGTRLNAATQQCAINGGTLDDATHDDATLDDATHDDVTLEDTKRTVKPRRQAFAADRCDAHPTTLHLRGVAVLRPPSRGRHPTRDAPPTRRGGACARRRHLAAVHTQPRALNAAMRNLRPPTTQLNIAQPNDGTRPRNARPRNARPRNARPRNARPWSMRYLRGCFGDAHASCAAQPDREQPGASCRHQRVRRLRTHHFGRRSLCIRDVTVSRRPFEPSSEACS